MNDNLLDVEFRMTELDANMDHAFMDNLKQRTHQEYLFFTYLCTIMEFYSKFTLFILVEDIIILYQHIK